MHAVNLIHENHSDQYFVSSDPDKLDIPFIHNWMANESYWAADIPLKLLERTLENSLCFGVYQNDGTQVGFGRVVTDFTTIAWLTDVFITEEHRGKGLSRFLMDTILAHPELRVVRRWLLGTDHAHGLYRKYGFKNLDHPENFLTKHRSQMYQDEQYRDLLDKFLQEL
jgi:GNAT superfamily N-acetyltransferase